MVFTRAVTNLIAILGSFQPLGGKPERILTGAWTRVAEVVEKKQQIMSKRPASSQRRDSLSWSASTIISQTGTKRPREGRDSAVVTQQTGPVAARAQHFLYWSQEKYGGNGAGTPTGVCCPPPTVEAGISCIQPKATSL